MLFMRTEELLEEVQRPSSVMKYRNMKVAIEISHLNSMGKFLQGPVDQCLFLKNYS